MEPHVAFRAGFLARCADEGLSIDETAARIKVAAGAATPGAWSSVTAPFSAGTAAAKSLWQGGASLVDAGTKAVGMAAGLGKWPLIAALPVGFGLGTVAADIAAPEAETPEDVKHRELLEAYRRAADRARRVAQRQAYRKPARRAAVTSTI